MNVLSKIILGSLVCLSCNPKQYNNKEHYQVKIGEHVEIYTKVNSCCFYCLTNQETLKSVMFLGEYNLDNGPKDCDGCQATTSFNFKASQIGTDTVYLKKVEKPNKCNNSDTLKLEKYIIQVI